MGTETIQPVNIARNLGVWIDRELSMKQHVVKVAGACFHQLRHLRQIRRRVGREVTTRLVLALVMSRLDYCNSLLAGLPASTVNILQRVQDAAAGLICNLSIYLSVSVMHRAQTEHCRAWGPATAQKNI